MDLPILQDKLSKCLQDLVPPQVRKTRGKLRHKHHRFNDNYLGTHVHQASTVLLTHWGHILW